MALLLIGCQSENSLGVFSAGDTALDVRLPDVCEAFLQVVPVPAVTRKTDARVAYSKTADALDEANTRLSIGGDCAADERSAYQKKPAAKP